jgi:hypothetical protein
LPSNLDAEKQASGVSVASPPFLGFFASAVLSGLRSIRADLRLPESSALRLLLLGLPFSARHDFLGSIL